MLASLEKVFNLPVVIIMLLLVYAFAHKEIHSARPIGTANLIQSRTALGSVGKACRVKVGKVNVRSTPNGEVVGTLNYADPVVNKGLKGSWVKTDSGYVYGDYLSC